MQVGPSQAFTREKSFSHTAWAIASAIGSNKAWGEFQRRIGPARTRETFKRDIPDARVSLLDTGHFALETRAGEIADAILAFFAR